MNEVKSVVLNVLHERVRRYVNENEINPQNINLDVDTNLEYLAHDMVITLTRRRASEDLGTVSHRFPEDWFQGFKERFFPKYLLSKFPVKYKELIVGASAFYDNISIPDQTTEVKVYVRKGQEFIK